MTKSGTETDKSPVTESATPGVSKTITTSISRGETPEFVHLDSSKVPLDAFGAIATASRQSGRTASADNSTEPLDSGNCTS